ncbi:exopolysaccharide production protein YjbE [Methylobacterium sp. J-076]|uniref:exopolysaccharide production protein YjbE n=1 Tax=Methylobacterium sp. J-076 TaxID=2836655 RepID=UPI001FB93455|nr:exopolysaccharide production protein YjbE [Methylobacterium sp. J-076]MCJ2013317.1 exopolysaccharide production protein YjbE [Methylobacterium sp. J-076]
MQANRVLATAAILVMTAGSAFAAPCNTGTAMPKSPDKQASNPKSSDMDKSSANLAGGNQPASPGTVGAMNNAGATQAQTSTGGTTSKDGTDPAAKNMAGGNQPASPGTVGAMNNAAAAKSTTNMSDKDC